MCKRIILHFFSTSELLTNYDGSNRAACAEEVSGLRPANMHLHIFSENMEEHIFKQNKKVIVIKYTNINTGCPKNDAVLKGGVSGG